MRGKPHDQAAVVPTTKDIHWAAGLFEGEGWAGPHGNGKSVTTATIQIAMTDREPLEKIHLLFGGRIYGPYGVRRGKDYYQWRAYGARALGIMQTLYVLLSPRRQNQIASVLDVYR